MYIDKRGRPTLPAVLLLTLLAGPAQAVPFAFVFDLPDWQFNDNPALFGTTGTLTLTADNGGATAAAQTWTNADLLSIDLVTDGSYANAWTLPGDVVLAVPSLAGVSYLSTDALGAPTLDLTTPADPDSSVVRVSNAGGTFQLAAFADSGLGFTPILLRSGPGSTGDTASVPRTGIVVQGRLLQAVPAPSSLLLAAPGLALLALRTLRRRRRARTAGD